MAKLLTPLRNMPEDEVAEVRELLAAHRIEFYETQPGLLGLNVGAIWVRHDEEIEHAKQLFDEYQRERGIRVRGEYNARRRRGETETLWQRFRHNPLAFLFLAAFAGFILYLSVMPFIRLGS